MKITLSQAENMLITDLIKYENSVNKENLKINQNQFDALVSFVYNLGEGNFKSSTLLKKIRVKPSDQTIRIEFNK
jgi:lysozyme